MAEVAVTVKWDGPQLLLEGIVEAGRLPEEQGGLLVGASTQGAKTHPLHRLRWQHSKETVRSRRPGAWWWRLGHALPNSLKGRESLRRRARERELE
jgi:hypothetical protein